MHMKVLSYVFAGLLTVTALSGCSNSTNNGGGGGNNPTTITVNFTGNPGSLAYQIGSGSYTAGTLSGNTLTFSVPNGTSNFSFAYLCGQGATLEETVINATINDGTTYAGGCASNTQLTVGSLTGSVDTSALTNPQTLEVASSQPDASYYVQIPVAQAPAFNVLAVKGTDDILLAVLDTNSAYIAAKELTSQQVPGTLNGGNTVTFGNADLTTPANITYNNLPAGATPSTYLFFSSATGGQYSLGTVTTTYPVMPATLLTGSATYELSSTAIAANGSAVSFNSFTNTGSTVTINFPNPWNCTAPVAANYPTFLLNSYNGFTGNSGRTLEASLLWIGGGNIGYSIYLVNYPDTVGSSGVTAPNLSNVSSVYPVPASGMTAFWSQGNTEFSSGKVGSTPANSTVSTVGCNGNFTVP